MNFVRNPVQDAAAGVCVADSPAALRTFLTPGCAAVIWRRQTPPEVQDWLNGLELVGLRARLVLPRSEIADSLRNIFDLAGMPSGPERDWLQSDIAALGGIFSDLMSTKFLRLRLEAVTTNACRKFHVDAIMARLVCTYRGTGTQYGLSSDNTDPERVFTVKTGAPILLRGTLWPENPPSGLRHRSPPIEGTGETRLVLVLDPVFDPHEED